MTSPDFTVPATRPANTTSPSIAGPCAPARSEVDTQCADAERLSAAAQIHLQRLREARRQHSELMRQREQDAQFRDRRRLNDDKRIAQSDYRAAMRRATDESGVRGAAATWLRRLDELNRGARLADDRAVSLTQRAAAIQSELPGLELAADAARISAEAAQVACLEARRTLAACEEETMRRSPSAMRPMRASVAPAIMGDTVPQTSDAGSVVGAARALMRGDRQTLLGLALRLAEETGLEAGRLQLLLLDLRDQILAKALDDFAFDFPENHPFWSQFPEDAARGVTASLSSMGYRFDGVSTWVDGHVPQVRDLALALSYCGYDPRSLRRPAGQAAIDGLWQGTTLESDKYLLACASDLSLSQLVSLLGPRAGRMTELWDIWGRLRPLLMRAG